VVKGALLGLGITLVALIPPIVHFISGPLGPLIGGFIASARTCRGNPRKAVAMGILMGLFMTVAVTIVVVPLSKTSDVLPGNASLMVLIIPIGAGTYTALLGVLGALMGSRSSS
jgi:hypothetical protein